MSFHEAIAFAEGQIVLAAMTDDAPRALPPSPKNANHAGNKMGNKRRPVGPLGLTHTTAGIANYAVPNLFSM